MIASLVQMRWWGALIAGLLLLASIPIANRATFGRSVIAMFDPADPTLQAYQSLQTNFGGNSVAMVVYRDDELWTTAGFRRNAELTRAIAQLDGVSGVLSPSVLNTAVQKIRPASLFSNKPPLTQSKDSVARGFDRMFAGYTHSPDHRHGAVVAMLAPQRSSEALAGIRALVRRWQSGELPVEPASVQKAPPSTDQSPIREMVLVGEPVLVDEAFDLIERDGVWLAALTLGLLSLVLFASLMDLRFVVLSLLVIVFAVSLTKATLVMMEIQLSLVSTILTAITTVITVTSVLHLGVRYQRVRHRGGTPLLATTTAIALLAVPIAMTCATDAAGFAALGVSRILPIRQFGLTIAISATAVFLGLILLGPAIMTLRSPRGFPQHFHQLHRTVMAPFQRTMGRFCLRIANASVIQTVPLTLVLAVIVLFILTGWRKVETETSFLKNFRPTSDIVSAYTRVETQFGGAGVWDVTLDAPSELTSAYFEQVRELERSLRRIKLGSPPEQVRLTKVISLADADFVTGRSRLMRLVPSRVRLQGMQSTMPAFYNAIVTSESNPVKDPDSGTMRTQRRLRLMLRSEENIGAAEKIALIEEVNRIVKASPLGENASVTGYYVLMAQLIDQLITDGWRAFAVSGLFVWILLFISGRSLRRATLALLINLLPALSVISVLGWMGGKVNMGSAMIAAVSIGLSIDGSIHFLASYRRRLARGHSPEQSASHAAAAIGVPMILATIALTLGFGGLATSEFVPTSTFGILVAATLILGTLFNLTFLPGLIARLDVAKSPSANRVLPGK